MSQREKMNIFLIKYIRVIHDRSRQTYGSPRIQATLRKEGIICGHNRVARLMQENKIIAHRRHRRFPITTRQHKGALAAPNLLSQNFTAIQPNQKWVSDITYIDTQEGWMYLAAILDLYSRKVVGWSMGEQINTQLVQKALRMAVRKRKPSPGMIHHSDRGCQFTSREYQESLWGAKILPSMSRSGNCYDNAVMESFFATLKCECANHRFVSRTLARNTIFEFIEVWYNRDRLHSTLNYLSPVEFEATLGH